MLTKFYLKQVTNVLSVAILAKFQRPFMKPYNFTTGHHRIRLSKGAKIRNRYNQVPHLTQDTNGNVTNSQLDTTNESRKVSTFPAGDNKAQINRRALRHSKHKTEKKHKKNPLGTVSKIIYWRV